MGYKFTSTQDTREPVSLYRTNPLLYISFFYYIYQFRAAGNEIGVYGFFWKTTEGTEDTEDTEDTEGAKNENNNSLCSL